MRSEALEAIVTMLRSTAEQRGDAAMTARRVLSVGYRLAPGDPHPAALDDVVSAYRWALASAGVDPARTVIGGDSAGGGLTVAALVALRDAGDPFPAAGVCLSPWVDLTQSGATITTNADVDPMVHAGDLDRWADAYRGERRGSDSAISPLFAELTGLPLLLIDVGTADVLLDDAQRLANRARGAGVEVTLTVVEDMLHVWYFFAGAVPEADEAIARVGAFVAKEAA
ncbi:MAG: alpha/beta hydrolase fold domain-containing protein [Acidimicrobiales bacterium]|nr:alpha/beta hydrolase fold domain-containing protein [Acidimicrobiales bacterium]